MYILYIAPMKENKKILLEKLLVTVIISDVPLIHSWLVFWDKSYLNNCVLLIYSMNRLIFKLQFAFLVFKISQEYLLSLGY